MNKKLEQEVTALLKEKRKIKDNSIKIYISNLNSIGKLLYLDNFQNLNFLNTPSIVIRAIKQANVNEATKYRYLTTIIGYLRAKYPNKQPHAYVKAFVEYKNMLNDEAEKQELKPYEKENWLTESEIARVSDVLLNTKDINNFVIWNLMTILPPRRSNDYCNMVITNKEKDDNTNYLIRSKDGFQKFVFNVYKNSGKKGSVQFDRNYIIDNFKENGKKMVGILDLYCKTKQNGEYLIKNFTPNSFTKYFSRIAKPIINKHFTINQARHQYISKFLASAPFLKEKQIVADFMSNTVNVQMLYRRRQENYGDGVKKVI